MKTVIDYSKVPCEMLCKDEYPTDEYIEWIKNYTSKEMSIEDFVNQLEWWAYDWGFTFRRKYKGHRVLELHTGGWSGNEEIISALMGNFHFRWYWKMTRVGGHYYFKIPIK